MKMRERSASVDHTASGHVDADEETDAFLKKRHTNVHYTVRKGLKLQDKKSKKQIYNTAHRSKVTVSHAPATRQWTAADEEMHEVKAHILDTKGLVENREWESLVGKGVTNLIIEDDDNALKEIPDAITHIQTLRKFSLKWSKKVKVLPPAMFRMDLQEICIQKCPMKKITGIHFMDGLTSLEISNGELKKIPLEIGEMTSLKHLDLTGNVIKVIPPGIGNLHNLESLRVRGNKLTSLPGSIINLDKLETLDASKNQIKDLPSDIGKISELITIRMSHNLLSQLPPSVKDLHNLKHLYLGNNHFTSIPSVLGQIHELLTLNLVSNQIQDIQTPLPRLTTLLLDRNSIHELRGALFGCINLEKLSLQNNSITTIPTDIKLLTKLRALYLAGNDIKELPEDLCHLQELRHLVLRETQISELPSGLDSLRKLSLVDIDSTNVSKMYTYALHNDGIDGLLEQVRMKRTSCGSDPCSSGRGSSALESEEDDDDELPSIGRKVKFSTKEPRQSNHRKTMFPPEEEFLSPSPILRDSGISSRGSVPDRRHEVQTLMPAGLEPVRHQSQIWSDEVSIVTHDGKPVDGMEMLITKMNGIQSVATANHDVEQETSVSDESEEQMSEIEIESVQPGATSKNNIEHNKSEFNNGNEDKISETEIETKAKYEEDIDQNQNRIKIDNPVNMANNTNDEKADLKHLDDATATKIAAVAAEPSPKKILRPKPVVSGKKPVASPKPGIPLKPRQRDSGSPVEKTKSDHSQESNKEVRKLKPSPPLKPKPVTHTHVSQEHDTQSSPSDSPKATKPNLPSGNTDKKPDLRLKPSVLPKPPRNSIVPVMKKEMEVLTTISER